MALRIILPNKYPFLHFSPTVNRNPQTFSIGYEVDIPAASLGKTITCKCTSSNVNYILTCANWKNYAATQLSQFILTITPSTTYDYNSIPVTVACFDDANNSNTFGINSTTFYPIPDIVFNYSHFLLPTANNLNPVDTTTNPIVSYNTIIPTGNLIYDPIWIIGQPLQYSYKVLDYSLNTFTMYNFNVWITVSVTNNPTNITPAPTIITTFSCTLATKLSGLSCTLNLITTSTIANVCTTKYYYISCNAITSGSTNDPGYNNLKCYDDFFTLTCPTTYTINGSNMGTTAKQNIRLCLTNIPRLTFLTELSGPVLQVDPNTDINTDIFPYIDMGTLLPGLIYTVKNNSPYSNKSNHIYKNSFHDQHFDFICLNNSCSRCSNLLSYRNGNNCYYFHPRRCLWEKFFKHFESHVTL